MEKSMGDLFIRLFRMSRDDFGDFQRSKQRLKDEEVILSGLPRPVVGATGAAHVERKK